MMNGRDEVILASIFRNVCSIVQLVTHSPWCLNEMCLCVCLCQTDDKMHPNNNYLFSVAPKI